MYSKGQRYLGLSLYLKSKSQILARNFTIMQPYPSIFQIN